MGGTALACWITTYQGENCHRGSCSLQGPPRLNQLACQNAQNFVQDLPPWKRLVKVKFKCWNMVQFHKFGTNTKTIISLHYAPIVAIRE